MQAAVEVVIFNAQCYAANMFRVMSGRINATWQSVAQYYDELSAAIKFGGVTILKC